MIDNGIVRERERERDVATNAQKLNECKNGINKEWVSTENHKCKFIRNFKRNNVSFKKIYLSSDR